MTYSEFIAKVSRASILILKKAYNFQDAVLSGLWLGIMSEKSLEYYNKLHYDNSRKYFDDIWNFSGLFQWEKDIIIKYFSNAGNILLIGAGSGREVLALSRMGYKIESYECNTKMIEYGNGFLERNKLGNTKIGYLPPDSVPEIIRKYDGIIIGWGTYSHIRGSEKRKKFLKGLIPFLKEESPLMISFLVNETKSRQDKIIKNISNFFRNFRKVHKTEAGDRLMSSCLHFFCENEIRNELSQSGYNILEYYDIDYGCVIAKV